MTLPRVAAPLAALALLLGVTVGPAAAADFRAGGELVIPAGETITEDVYFTGGTMVVEGTIDGDLTVAAGRIHMRGTVTGSINSAGGEIRIGGEVGGAVRAAGGQVTISAQVGRDVVVTGGNVVITADASVGGDVAGGVGLLDMAGAVEGDVIAGAGELIIRGSVGGNVDSAVSRLRIESQARIAGDVRYASEREVEIATGAAIGGNVERRDPQRIGTGPLIGDNPLTVFLGSLLALLLLGWTMLLVRPAALVAPGALLLSRPLPVVGAGLAAWLGQFLLLIVLVVLVALVGQLAGSLGGAFLAPLALLVLAFVAALLLSQAWVAMAIGSWLAARTRPMSTWLVYSLGAAVWALLLGVLGFIAGVLGGLLFVIAWVLGLGAITLYVLELRRRDTGAGHTPTEPATTFR